MVALSDVNSSNARITSTLPKHLVAVFAGATTGIGEATLKKLIKYAVEPRVYLFARNPASAARVIAECRQISPHGVFTFIKVDLSLIKETDRACEEVKRKEKTVNLIVLSAGLVSFGNNLTCEGLNLFLAASTYTRIRIAQQLLPLLTAAAATTPLARVIDVAGGTREGPVDTTNIGAINMPISKLRAHTISLHTLAWEMLAHDAPSVSFIHSYPGSVYTELHKGVSGVLGWLLYIVITAWHTLLGRWMFVPIDECGERHVFLATSGRYKPRTGGASGLDVPVHDRISRGSDGVMGSGVYSISWDGEGPTDRSVGVLEGLKKDGVRELAWRHFVEEFDRVRKGTGDVRP